MALSPLPSSPSVAPAPAPPTAPRYAALRLSLLVGAGWDAAFGLGAVVSIEGLASIVRVESIAEPHTLRFLGVVVLGLALFYLVAAADLRRSVRGAAAAVAIRAIGGLYFVGHTIVDRKVPWVFLAVGIADLAFAAIHYGLLRKRVGRGLVSAALRG